MEILACPHCHRQFRTSPAVLGKRIRCRDCRQVFHVPHDTSSVPLGPAAGGAGADQEGPPPVAIECVVGGRDARRCPSCAREFLMQAAFVGKVIRCRGCAAPFRVAASKQPVGGSMRAGVAPPPSPPAPPPSPSRAARAAANSHPPVFEDVGDVLADVQVGEVVASVVRPRSAAVLNRTDAGAVGTLVAVVLGGLCAIPLTLFLLQMISPREFEKVSALLPGFLTAWLR